MKYKMVDKDKGWVPYTFNDLHAGDVFYILNDKIRAGILYIKLLERWPSLVDEKLVFNAISLQCGSRACIDEEAYVAKLVTPISFYSDDFKTGDYEQERKEGDK